MTRQPIYHEKNQDFRIASFPCDQWQYQSRRAGLKGANANKSANPPRQHFDPWYALARPTAYNVAKAQLDTLTPA